MTFGVTPTGFRVKPYAQTLAEIEALMRTEFGPDVVQSAESPLGQLNALFADLATGLWEVGLDVYQSYDPDQAEGPRLDSLAKLRVLSRGIGETDEAFRQAITNIGRARIDLQDIVRAVRAVPGVTYVQAFVNDADTATDFGLNPGAVAVAVLGGEDEAVAAELRRFVVPGVETYGNTRVTTLIDGLCRSFNIVRPFVIPVSLALVVRRRADRLGCPPPAGAAIRDALVADLNAAMLNGDDVTLFRVRQAVESRWAGQVELVSFTGERDGLASEGANEAVRIGFVEIASFAAADITVTDAP